MKVDDLLDNGTHAVATVGNLSLRHLLLDPGNLDILQISHTGDTVLTAEIHQQRRVDSGEHHGALQRGTNHRSLWQMEGQLGIARHEDIGVERLAILPGVGKVHHRKFVVLND